MYLRISIKYINLYIKHTNYYFNFLKLVLLIKIIKNHYIFINLKNIIIKINI